MLTQRGFSILELIVAMSIIALFSALGLRYWQEQQLRQQLTHVTWQMMRFLAQVKNEATYYNNNVFIYLLTDAQADSCLVASTEPIPNRCAGTLHFKIDRALTVSGSQPASIYATEQFLPQWRNKALLTVFYGRRNTAQPVTIRLQNRFGESQIIVSAPGRLRYCAHNVSLMGIPPC